MNSIPVGSITDYVPAGHPHITKAEIGVRLPIKVKRLSLQATIPTYGTAGAAGFDLYATHGGVLGAGERVSVGTGIAVELPPGHAMFILPRSGYAAKHGVTVLNAPGLIDCDYRGEIKVILVNHDNEAVQWAAGQRIAQALVLPVPACRFEEVDELSETARGDGGLGSTGA